MNKSPYYEPDRALTNDKNITLALFAIANELRELKMLLGNFGYSNFVNPDGSIHDFGAMELIAKEIRDGFDKVSSEISAIE